MEKSSEVKEFYKLSASERLEYVRNFANLTQEEATILSHYGGLGAETANRMVENVVGTTQLPIGIATGFKINGRDYLIPFAIEEPSVVAGASKAAKTARVAGGFTVTSTEPVMIGQIQLVNPRFGENDWANAIKTIKENESKLVAFANTLDKTLVEHGGGACKLETRVINSPRGKMLIAHLLVDVRDAMGANAVNSMCEALAPKLEELTGASVRLRIISNLAVHRTAHAKAVFPKSELAVEGICDGEETVERILDA
ncbi:3-hydroxy-3-methylglutaryl-CoA reductase, partial [Candidatus Micrarchaeota archaeon]|nr:3-hydroxy-3-methylglutaryl-CoA reductase [Candidatus Micrarchaeota archaeon]